MCGTVKEPSRTRLAVEFRRKRTSCQNIQGRLVRCADDSEGEPTLSRQLGTPWLTWVWPLSRITMETSI